MAISGGDGSIVLTTKVDEAGLKKGLGSMEKTAKSFGAGMAKSFAVIGAAAATAAVSITKMAVSAYADYEQLVGGVETLFKDSAGKVLEYANQAFATTGQSANEYMRNVTAFSASLLSAVGGDTERAAEVANAAMISISDNVNKMGSSAESVTLAFQGFAKQQYMLLDNLKLGYGGTKTEMERLLKDAQAITGVEYNIDNLADVYTAIGVIQEKLGIAGTTAKEAESTISGSAAMMKAAWQNVLAAIAGGGDLDRAINNLVYSVTRYFQNIVPIVQQALLGIGRLIEQVAPALVQNVASALIQAIPSLINAVFQMIIGLAKGIWQGIKALFTGGSGSVTADIKTSVGGIATEAGNASAGMEELGDATEKAGKQAKKTTAAFDDLNILASNAGEAATSTPSAGGIGGGSFDTSGVSSAESAVGGLASSMQGEFSKIAEMAKGIWDSDAVQSFVTAAKSTLSAFGSFVSTLWSDIKNNGSMTWQNIESNLRITAQNLVALWTGVWTDYSEAVDKWSPKIIENISGFFNSIWTTAIDPAVQLISKMWADFTGILVSLWEKHGQPLLDNIGEFATNVIAFFQKIYDSIIEPIVTPFLETLSWLWEKHISKWVEKIVDFVLKLVNGALEIYNKFISPLISWLLEKLSPAWSALSSLVIGVFGTIFATVGDTISSIIGALGGLIDFITGIFTGNWQKAWQGVKDVFKNIVEGLWGIIKLPLNLIIDGINSLISGLNKVKLPDWDILGGLAGKGINIPKIPKLAQGAVIPPNREFLAILGDNKKENEIVSPVSAMKQTFMEAISEMGFGSQPQREDHYYLNEQELMSVVYRLFRGGERLNGERLVMGGAY